MIKIKKSQTATCDWSKVTKEQLEISSRQHINDVRLGMDFFKELIDEASKNHDRDKITALDQFHTDFITGFKQTGWWDNHRKISRHHLLESDGIPIDVNLIDVIDMIIDCVMAGMGRTGSVYPLNINTEILLMAFTNTVELLKNQVQVVDDDKENG